MKPKFQAGDKVVLSAEFFRVRATMLTDSWMDEVEAQIYTIAKIVQHNKNNSTEYLLLEDQYNYLFQEAYLIPYNSAPNPEEPTPMPTDNHKSQQSVIDILNAGEVPILVGPTGSGKTTSIVRNILPELNITPDLLTIVQVSRETSRYDLIGYRSTAGNPVPGSLTEILTRGEGIICFDELDKGNENTLLILKGIFAGRIETPFGVHTIDNSKLKLIATANTFGSGASLDYNAAVRQDQALMNEFITVEWNYDTKFEAKLINEQTAKLWGKHYTNLTADKYAALVGKSFIDLRETCVKHSSGEIFSTRQIRQVINLMLISGWKFSNIIHQTSLREADETSYDYYKELLSKYDRLFEGREEEGQNKKGDPKKSVAEAGNKLDDIPYLKNPNHQTPPPQTPPPNIKDLF